MSYSEQAFWAGLKPIQHLLDDPDITEIAINGDEDFLFTSGVGGRKKHDIDINTNSVKAAIISLAHHNQKDATKKEEPIVSQKIGDYRVTGILEPVSYKGNLLRIRKHTSSDITLEQMLAAGNITEYQKRKLTEIIKNANNVLVSGGTSSGKTTALNAMLAYVPQNESVVTIESGIELKIEVIDNTRLLEFPERGCAANELLEITLRLTPDRIIVGEIRKPKEASTFLDVMGAGHDGCAATIHANSAKLTLMRFESLVTGHSGETIATVRSRIASVLEYVVHFNKDKQTHTRSLDGMVMIDGLSADGEYILKDITFNDD